MKILAIGNSFSQDATRYLQAISKKEGENLKVVNLYIGGCSLRTHYLNILEDKKAYVLEYNGVSTGFYVSVKEALMNDDWDVVTLQQASHYSINYETYQPYLSAVAEYVRKYSPKSKLYIHQTWAYEEGSDRLCKELGYSSANDMLSDIKASYERAAAEINADGIIPAGELFGRLLQNGIKKIHRDTFHATLGLGRYALGLLWYGTLTGKSIDNISFSELDEAAEKDELEIVKMTVRELI